MGYRWRRCASGWWQRGYGGRRSARGRGFTRAGPDGRRWASWCRSTVPPRVVRGSGAALHVDRVHRRRHQSADGAAFCRGRDHRSLPRPRPPTAAASTRSTRPKAAATASVAPPSPSVKASTAPSPSLHTARKLPISPAGKTLDYRLCARSRPGRRPSPQTTKKASAVPSTRPAPSSANALATNPPQTTPGTAGLASTQPLPPLPHSHPPRPALADPPWVHPPVRLGRMSPSRHSCLPVDAVQRVTPSAEAKRWRRVAPWLAMSKGYSPSHKGDILALLKGDILALG